MSEYDKIVKKLGTIQTPAQLFHACYHSIMRNIKLQYLMVPSLLVLALSNVSQSSQEKFAAQFRTMILDRFLRNPQFFAYEIGHMASELIFFIYDYLVDFDRTRKMVHCQVMSLFLRYVGFILTFDLVFFNFLSFFFFRNRVHRFDNEYSGVRSMLKFIHCHDVARLAYASHAYPKALMYMERLFNDMRQQNVSKVALDDFVQEHLNFFTKIYAGMKDLDSVEGCTIIRQTLPSLEQTFNCAMAKEDSLTSLLSGNQLMRFDR